VFSGLGRFLFLAGFVAISCSSEPRPTPPAPLPDHRSLGFHGDRRKLGWADAELGLPPRLLTQDLFGVAWESPALDGATIGGKKYPPLVYASPLFARSIGLPDVGVVDVVYVATNSGFIYAISAAASEDAATTKPGTILWKHSLVAPAIVPKLDGGVPMGFLSTPVLDVDGDRLYLVGHDAELGWLAFCIDARDGATLPGWPIPIDEPTLTATNANGPALFPPSLEASQRSALALSPSGDRLYVAFGTYTFGGPGWLVSIDTAIAGTSTTARITKSFSAAPFVEANSNGGMWSAGGPAVDPSGRVWITTGNSPKGTLDAPKVWGNSLLVFDRDLKLEASYTPYNYCKLDENNLDVGASAPLLLPNLNPAQTTSPQLVGFGSKNGSVYLLDRNRVPARVDKRPPCEPTDSEKDASLHSPSPQSHLTGKRGPLNVFGPYSDELGEVDLGKMRSRPAYYRDKQGDHHLVVTGTYKSSVNSPVAVPPGVAKLKVVLTPDKPAWLEEVALNTTVALKNPGSPVVTGEGDEAVVWVLDSNAQRSDSLLDPKTGTPILYAFAAKDLNVLWQSPPTAIRQSGKYSVPAIGNNRVYVASDKLTAFAPK